MLLRLILSIVIGIILIGYLYLKYHPVFGGKASEEKINRLRQSLNFTYGKFNNEISTVMDTMKEQG